MEALDPGEDPSSMSDEAGDPGEVAYGSVQFINKSHLEIKTKSVKQILKSLKKQQRKYASKVHTFKRNLQIDLHLRTKTHLVDI